MTQIEIAIRFIRNNRKNISLGEFLNIYNWQIRRLFLYVLWLVLPLSFSLPTSAQNKFYATPNRGGVEGARGNAQMKVLLDQSTRMHACTEHGGIYAPTHPSADASGCTNVAGLRYFETDVSVTGSLSVSGTTAFEGPIKIGSGGLCNSSQAGSLRYNATDKQLELCEGTSWLAVGSGGGGAYPCSYAGTPREAGFSYTGACSNTSPSGCFSCGWTLVGTQTTYTCESDGTWSETNAGCSVYCGDCAPGDAGDW